MPSRRVAITGLGVISALGPRLENFWDALKAGRSGLRPLFSLADQPLQCRIGGEVPDFDPLQHFEPRTEMLMDRFAQFAVIAARQAVLDADVHWSDTQRTRTAVVTGTSIGGQGTQDAGFLDLYGRGKERVHPFTLPRSMANAGAAHISMDLQITGPCLTLATACASGTHAIGQAFWMVRNGVSDAAIAGGSEAPFSLGNMKGWEALRALDPETCRPFSRDRRGTVLSEGGAMVFMEPLEQARARGARIHGEIVGFGMSADAFHVTHPTDIGAAQAMLAAMDDAQLRMDQIGYLNAHGTGTLINDRTETAAIRQVFGRHASRLAVSSTKSMHGHGQGASGAMEAIATVLALRDQVLPPTVNFREPDPECDLDVVPNQARGCSTEYALSNSFGFGGMNGVLAFRR